MELIAIVSVFIAVFFLIWLIQTLSKISAHLKDIREILLIQYYHDHPDEKRN